MRAGAAHGDNPGANVSVSVAPVWWKKRCVTQAAADYYEVELGFYEAARGGRRRVPYTARAVCAFCMAEPYAGCDGGTRRVSVDDGDVEVLQLVSCEDCGGTGRTAADCEYCGGSGEVRVESETEITIPVGIEDGAAVPLGKHGEHVVVRVRPQPREPAILRVAAALGLVAALGFLAFLLLS